MGVTSDILGSSLVSNNEVNPHWAWLVLGWATVSGLNPWCGTFILVCDQPFRLTQPGHPWPEYIVWKNTVVSRCKLSWLELIDSILCHCCLHPHLWLSVF